MQGIKKNQRWYKKAYLIIFIISFFLIDCMLPLNSHALIGIKKGDRPKEIVLNDINGKRTDISALFGKKPVILVFWELPLNNSFLDYSQDELIFLNDFYEEHHQKNSLEIFAIYTPEEEGLFPDTEISAVRNLISTNKIEFPVIIDKEFRLFRKYGIIALPTTIMINKEGNIEFIYPSFPLAGRPIFSREIKNLVGIEPAAEKKEATVSGKHDSHANKLYRYALQMYKKGLLEQSLSPLRKSLDIEPDNSWTHNLLGIILWERGNLEQSVEEFRNAIKLDNNLAARLNYTVLLIEKGSYYEAEKFLLESPQSQSYFKLIGHYLLGYVYNATEQTEKAIKELEFSYNLIEEESYEIDKSTPRAFSFKITILHDLSLLYNAKGNKQKALELLHQAFHYLRDHKDRSFTEDLRQIKHLMIYE